MDVIQKWPKSGEMNQTVSQESPVISPKFVLIPNVQGFALANDGKSVPEVLAGDPERAMRFMSGMQAVDHVPGYAIEDVSGVYDWDSLGNAYVVNVGGSRGQAAIELAKMFPNLTLLVQDSAMMIQGAEAAVPVELEKRVKFMQHELFAPQTVEAQIYFFRMVFRGLGDKYAVQVLKALVPVLRSGVKILIQDVCMPEPDAIPLWRERIAR